MGTSTAWGRIAEDGTVYVRTADEGERVVGSWQAGTPEEGLAHFVRRYDDLATEVGLLETRLASGAASASSTVVAVTKLRASLPDRQRGRRPRRPRRTTLHAARGRRGQARRRAGRQGGRRDQGSRREDARWPRKPRSSRRARSGSRPATGCAPSSTSGRRSRVSTASSTPSSGSASLRPAPSSAAAAARTSRLSTSSAKKPSPTRRNSSPKPSRWLESTEWTPTANRYKSLMVAMEDGGARVERCRRSVVAAIPRRPRHVLHPAHGRTRRTRSRVPQQPEAKEALLVEAEAIDPAADLRGRASKTA